MVTTALTKKKTRRVWKRVLLVSGSIVLVAAVLIGGVFLWALTATDSSLLARGLIWGEADILDWQKFPGRTIRPSDTPLIFSTENK